MLEQIQEMWDILEMMIKQKEIIKSTFNPEIYFRGFFNFKSLILSFQKLRFCEKKYFKFLLFLILCFSVRVISQTWRFVQAPIFVEDFGG